jgi:5-formyltetrahydrofolate cyclo-ligase
MPVNRSISPDEIRTLGLTLKTEVRSSMLRTRTMMPRETRSAMSRAIAERLCALDVWKSARSVALYHSIISKGEVESASLEAAARAEGKRVAYPRLDGDSPLLEDQKMSFRWVDEVSTLVGKGRGFREPPADAEVATMIDLIVVPGLAFDPAGYRIGYGAGLYDRALPAFSASVTIGVAFDFQVVMEIPRGPHDVPVSMIVTDKRVLSP